MTTDEVEELHQARRTLVRMRRQIARNIGRLEVGPVSLAADLRTVLDAIEALDRALSDAGHPYLDVEPGS